MEIKDGRSLLEGLLTFDRVTRIPMILRGYYFMLFILSVRTRLLKRSKNYESWLRGSVTAGTL